MHTDHPGALLEILEQFAGRGVNLCRIESRPTKTGLGNYCFSIDAEGHLRDPRVAEAMLGLHRICEDVVFLGSYQRADGVRPTIARGFTDHDFTAARQWYAGLVNPDDEL
jgi:prephenate dehydratase